MDNIKLANDINNLAKVWNASGVVRVLYKDERIYQGIFGYADRDQNIRSPEEPTYLLSSRAKFLQAIALFLLAEEGKFSFDEPLDKILPEYAQSSHITTRQLLMHESGLPDYFYNHLMIDKNKNTSHQKLDEEMRFVKEHQWFYEPITYQEVLSIIGDELLFKPGSQDYWSATNSIFLETIITRLSKEPAHVYIQKKIFEPLGMHDTIYNHQANTVSYVCMRDVLLLRAPHPGKEGIYTINANDLEKLTLGLKNKRLLKEESWNEGLISNPSGEALICTYRNGTEVYESSELGYELTIYVDPLSSVAYFHATNESLIMKNKLGEWTHFCKGLRECIESETTYPSQPYLDSYNEQNAWAAMHLKLNKDQNEFVIDAKTSIGFAFSKPKEKKTYVLMDRKRAIGLMVLAIEPEKDIFKIDILIVDRRYQNRGYGKIMLNKGLDILKSKGAKKFDIIVNRFNTPAYRLYLSLGFVETGVYESGIRLSKKLDAL